MPTLTFAELDAHAQAYAVDRYGQEQTVDEMVAEMQDDTSADKDFTPANIFGLLGWRFNERGERV